MSVKSLCFWMLFAFAGISAVAQNDVTRAAVINGVGNDGKNDVFCDLLFAELLKNNELELVDRETVDKILREQSISGESDTGSLVKAGNILRADLLIMLLNGTEKSKLCFFDVNHGLRVAVCDVDPANNSKSLKTVNASLKNALAFVGGRGNPIYSVPPFFNNDILYQNDKYQGLLAAELRDELMSKGALLIEFDEALRIFGELGLSQGDDHIKALPLTLISGEFFQNKKDKNSLDLKLSKIQLADSTSSLWSGTINAKDSKSVRKDIVKIASNILKEKNKPVALDLKKQVEILLKKASEHMSAEAYEQARMESAVAIMMDPSSVEARKIFCSSILKAAACQKYHQKGSEYFFRLYLHYIESLEWLVVNNKKPWDDFTYYVGILRAARAVLNSSDFDRVAGEFAALAERCIKYSMRFADHYAVALKYQRLGNDEKVRRLVRVVIEHKTYDDAFWMGDWCFGQVGEGNDSSYAEFFYLLMNDERLPAKLRIFSADMLDKINKRCGRIWFPVSKISLPEEGFKKYLEESPDISRSAVAAAARMAEESYDRKDYNDVRLKLDSIRKCGQVLTSDQTGRLLSVYEWIMSEIRSGNADPLLKRSLYLKYAGKHMALYREAFINQLDPHGEYYGLNFKKLSEMAFAKPEDKACLAEYRKIIDDARWIYENTFRLFSYARAAKDFSMTGYLQVYCAQSMRAFYFDSFNDRPAEELAAALARINAPGSALWIDSSSCFFRTMLFGEDYRKKARELAEYLAKDKQCGESAKKIFEAVGEWDRICKGPPDADIDAIIALSADPSSKRNAKPSAREFKVFFQPDVAEYLKSIPRDLIPCGTCGDVLLYDQYLMFIHKDTSVSKFLTEENCKFIEYLSDAVWDGERLWYAVINKGPGWYKKLSRCNIMAYNLKQGKMFGDWGFKEGVELEFMNESENWKKEKEKDFEFTQRIADKSYTAVKLFPCEGKIFVFTSFCDPASTGNFEHRVWIGVIEGSKPLKIFYSEKVSENSPLYSRISFTNKAVSYKNGIIRYYGRGATMLIDASSLKVSFKEYREERHAPPEGERCRAIGDYVFFDEGGLYCLEPTPDEMAVFFKLAPYVNNRTGRNNFFQWNGKLYLFVESNGLYLIKSSTEVPAKVADIKELGDIDDLLVSSNYGLWGMKNGKFYSVTLP